MRIRKHAALLLSATSSTTTTKLEPHVCQLNQSPWDVYTNFSPPSTPPAPLPLPPTQVNKHENAEETSPPPVTAISISPVKREEDLSCDIKSDSSDCGDDVAAVESNEEVVLQCCKTDGKSWRCRRDAVEGGAMCEHHLYLARNHGSSKVKRVVVAEVALPEATEKRRPRPRKASSSSSSSSNPYDFYYYSGFGPHWGKRRGKEHGEDSGISSCNNDNVPTVISSASDVVENVSSPSQSINREIDYIDDDDEEEDSENEELCKRKRARKPVKARSLKSLTMSYGVGA